MDKTPELELLEKLSAVSQTLNDVTKQIGDLRKVVSKAQSDTLKAWQTYGEQRREKLSEAE